MDVRRGPGRPRGFDEDDALARVVEVFWTRGFEGASYADLEAATGLRRQSLRYAFGDKASLFQRALAAYAERKTAEIEAALRAAPTPLEGVAAALALWRRDAEHPEGRGCLVVNALAEFGRREAPAMTAVRATTARLRRALAAAFRAGQAAGQVRRDLDADALAAQTVALGDGLVVDGRGGALPDGAGPAVAAFLRQIAA